MVRRQTTKDLLVASFLELAHEHPIDKITVTQIARNCGVSQPTFYHHFKDKYDLISWEYATNAGKIMAGLDKGSYGWRDTLLEGARYFEQNRAYMLNALRHTSGRDSFVRNVTAINDDLLTKLLCDRMGIAALPLPLQCHIRIYCHGTVQFLFDWLSGEVALTAENVADIWDQSLPQPLRTHLEH
ncbi:TetR family transcriptional regulator [Eggerthellaceae bacterium zg-1084]|uniref:TetR family transcriptional regulator n=1 Tax=Berryella wangjianweii TaxID=2734634 RepID=UPI0015528DFA|nr:TetR family transcriptional regulator [Berryella wangjianweii]NPD30401.1 TetR family transcriptional regulator [Berryella wangjianweii]